MCMCIRWHPESQTRAQNMFSLSNPISAEALIEKTNYKIEIHRKNVYAFADIQNPRHMQKIWISLSNHIPAEAQMEKMHYKTEIHRKFVYAFADIQNPKHMPKIRFSLSNHISAEAPIEKMYY